MQIHHQTRESDMQATSYRLDTIEIEVRFYPVLGLQTDQPFTSENARVFRFGTIAGRHAGQTILSERHRSFIGGVPVGEAVKFQTRAEFDATVASYDADPRWSRTKVGGVAL